MNDDEKQETDDDWYIEINGEKIGLPAKGELKLPKDSKESKHIWYVAQRQCARY